MLAKVTLSCVALLLMLNLLLLFAKYTMVVRVKRESVIEMMLLLPNLLFEKVSFTSLATIVM
jgi:hypothetical protein